MTHADADRLLALALGEPEQDPTEADHLRDCPDCTWELTALRAVVDVGRAARAEQDLPPVPAGVWDRIAADTGQRPHPPPLPKRSTPRKPLARRRTVRLVAVAVVAALLGVGGTLAVQRIVSGGASTPVADSVIARATLTPQVAAPADARGTVEIVRTPDGPRLRLTMRNMPAPQGLYEIWLFDGRTSMIPLGVSSSDSGADVAVPASISVSGYPIVDVSAQRIGQQEHGLSMLRGSLGP